MDVESLKPLSPCKEDALFKSDAPDWWNNACLHTRRGADHHGYTEGYRRGARLLVEHVMEQQRDQDYLVYPVMFLYRHHVELALKSILGRLPYLIDREATSAENEHLGTHRLDLLWQDLEPLLAELGVKTGWGPLPAADVEGIDSYIKQLTDLDRDSFAFRYARSKKKAPSLPPDFKYVNLRHFAEMWERLANYLDGLDAATSELEENKAYMERDWQSEMAQDEDF